MNFKVFYLFLLSCFLPFNELSICGFTNWKVGHDPETIQLIPHKTDNGLSKLKGKTVAHVRFKVVKYGEMSFPINPKTPIDTEALAVDLSNSTSIEVIYKANTEVILQLREYNIHGGVQNHIILPPSSKFIKRSILLSSFQGGLKSLNYKNLAKFNFAFLKNDLKDGYADLIVKSFKIQDYNP